MLLPTACDPGRGEGSASAPEHDDDDHGDSDDDDDDDEAGDVYIRAFDIGDFTYAETIVYEWGDCTTTRTMQGVGNGDCSV
ncbi:MAG: hypothetical protein K1X88_35990, partial [Nannocystaceae bacterium]|nr:hypothetical protein [Nannocystaceae bacterium]